MKNFYLLITLLFSVCFMYSQNYKQMISKGTYTVQQIQTAAEAHFQHVGTERGKGYKPYKRWEYQALKNMDENGLLKSPEFYYNELENYNSYVNENYASARTTVGTWEQVGPTYWDQSSGWNPGVGRVTSIAIEPTNPDHIIVGANTGGVWKTLNGGASWTVLTDNLSNLNVSALAIDPTNASTYFWGSTSGTIFKSTDAGSTWAVLADTGQGNVNKILIDPNNTNKMYCSVEFGGIYKSTDAGINWTLIDNSANTGYDVEFKPGDTNTIYASGTSFYKSVDGGSTFISTNGLDQWSQEYIFGQNSWSTAGANQNNTVAPRTGNSMAICYISNFSSPMTNLVTPSLDLSGAVNPQLSFSYTNVNWAGDIDVLKVLYKTDLDSNWIELASYTEESASWTDITLDLPDVTSDYYIAFEGTANYGRGLTLDDVSVETVTGIVFEDGFETALNNFSSGPKMIGVSADDPEVVYVLESANGRFGAFHKSIDAGSSFNSIDHTGKNYFGYSSLADDDSGQAPRDMDIAVNPVDANEVHIAGVLSWLSIDGGINFDITSQWIPQNAINQNIGYCHADIDILEYVNDKLYVGSDGGIFVANTPTTVNNNYYTDLTAGLGIRQFYNFGISQTDPVVITGGSQDNGTSTLNASGEWTDWLGADGMEGFVDKTSSTTIYGTIYNGVMFRSLNGGVSYTSLPSPEEKSGNWVTPFEQDPILQNVIYSGFDEVYKSTNAGNTWISISQNFGNNLNELKIAPSNSNIMLASFGDVLYKTTSGGAFGDWNQITGFNGNINSIAIHPTNPDKIALATTGSQKVYISNNGGVSWVSYALNLPDFSARALVWENNGKDGLYLGMNYGVYYIDNTLTEWQPFSNNLPNVIVSELEINSADGKIYVATYGRGIWSSNLYDPTLSINNFELNNLSLYPNPAKNSVTINWDNNDLVSIRIFDASGKLTYFNKSMNISNSTLIDVSNYSAGIYFVRINNLQGSITKKLIIE